MKSNICIVVVCFVFAACSKGGDGNPTPVTPSPAVPILVSPQNNTTCLSGTNVDANKTSVTLSWQSAPNADSYDLVVKNLLSAQQATYAVSGLSKDLVLDKAQPYSWYVVSKSSKIAATAQSTVWKFYVAGNPTNNYAPFPATIIAPAPNAAVATETWDTTAVSFHWSGADVDNDIAFYTIYLDDKNASTMVKASVLTTSVSITLANYKTYYWRVVTTDAAGNTSDSGVSSFSL